MVSTQFNVHFAGTFTVKAAGVSVEPYIKLKLSNFDLLSGRYPVTVFHAYPKPQFGDFYSVITVIKSSLSETLRHYYPFAGRIVPNTETGEPEILCNNEGIEVVEARADVDLASLDFFDLSQSFEKKLVPAYPHEVPLRLQVTSYTCGGFSISWSFDHALGDATAFNTFLVTWSEIARNKPISKYPDHCRTIFRPRVPPTYDPSLDRTFSKCTMEEVVNTPMVNDISLKRLYFIEASDVDRLQEEASQDGEKRTKIEAFSAYLWKILATAVEVEEGSDNKQCKLGWLIDGRQRMLSFEVSNLVGNAVSMAVGEASLVELKQSSLGHVGGIVHKAISKVTNEEHFLDLIDWIECHRPGMVLAKILLGIGGPAVIVSSGRQFPSTEVDLGFGPPVLGTCYSTILRLGAGYVNPQPSARGDGSWVVFSILWPKLAEALESDPDHVFKPLTATHLGLMN